MSFDQLRALAILDMKIRKSILSACIDVEHSLKIKILQEFEKNSEDGYAIIQEFFKTNLGQRAANNIAQKHTNIYVKDLVDKYIYPKESSEIFSFKDKNDVEYNLDLPIWAMLEVITFGELFNFYVFFYSEKTSIQSRLPVPMEILHKVKNIRNACAHNNCLLNHLNDSSANIPPKIGKYAKNLGISQNTIQKKLKCNAFCEMVCTFYCLDDLATSQIRKHDYKDLSEIINDFCSKYYSLFEKNELVKTSIDFLKNIIDKLNSAH